MSESESESESVDDGGGGAKGRRRRRREEEEDLNALGILSNDTKTTFDTSPLYWYNAESSTS